MKETPVRDLSNALIQRARVQKKREKDEYMNIYVQALAYLETFLDSELQNCRSIKELRKAIDTYRQGIELANKG